MNKRDLENIYRILQNAAIMHFEEPEVEALCQDFELQKALNAVEDALEVPADRRFKYEG